MGKIAVKVPKLEEKMYDFPFFSQKFFFKVYLDLEKKTSKKKEQSASPKRHLLLLLLFS